MIDVHELTKHYRGHTAVDRVSFRCEPGTVTGFLGPNGAGKSTTLRMLCGLTAPDRGTATIAGVPYRRLGNPGRRVGVLLDAAAQHRGRTGHETLALAAQTLGVGRDRVDELLTLVELDRAARRRRVGGYSLGMRQRLGIACALLGDPQVLVLDEPANGLDPAGIHWIRTLLRDFADRGGTVLLSSHLLREIETIADRLVVIAGSRIVADGDQSELLAGWGDLEQMFLSVTTNRPTTNRATTDRATPDRATDSRATDSRATGSRATDSRATDSRAADSRMASLGQEDPR